VNFYVIFVYISMSICEAGGRLEATLKQPKKEERREERRHIVTRSVERD